MNLNLDLGLRGLTVTGGKTKPKQLVMGDLDETGDTENLIRGAAALRLINEISRRHKNKRSCPSRGDRKRELHLLLVEFPKRHDKNF